MELFRSQVFKTIKDFGQPLPILCYPQNDFFFFLFTSSLKLSFQLVPVTSQPSTLNPCAEPGSISSQVLGMLSSPLKSSLPQAGQVLLPEPLITGQACQVVTIVQALTPGFYVSVHQDPPGCTGSCQEMCFPASQTTARTSQISAP